MRRPISGRFPLEPGAKVSMLRPSETTVHPSLTMRRGSVEKINWGFADQIRRRRESR